MVKDAGMKQEFALRVNDKKFNPCVVDFGVLSGKEECAT